MDKFLFIERSEDKFLGCFYGVALGDALGAPFEFARTKPKLEYDGYLVDEDVEVTTPFIATEENEAFQIFDIKRVVK